MLWLSAPDLFACRLISTVRPALLTVWQFFVIFSPHLFSVLPSFPPSCNAVEPETSGEEGMTPPMSPDTRIMPSSYCLLWLADAITFIPRASSFAPIFIFFTPLYSFFVGLLHFSYLFYNSSLFVLMVISIKNDVLFIFFSFLSLFTLHLQQIVPYTTRLFAQKNQTIHVYYVLCRILNIKVSRH